MSRSGKCCQHLNFGLNWTQGVKVKHFWALSTNLLFSVQYKADSKQNMVFLKYGFCKKSFRKDETLTSWTQVEHLFNILIIKIRFSLSNEENLIISNVLIRGKSNFDEMTVNVQLNKVSFLKKLLFFKIHTLTYSKSALASIASDAI